MPIQQEPPNDWIKLRAAVDGTAIGSDVGSDAADHGSSIDSDVGSDAADCGSDLDVNSDVAVNGSAADLGAHDIAQSSDFEELEKEKKLKQAIELIDGLNALFYQKTVGPEKNEKGQDSQRRDYERSYFKTKAGSPVKIDGNDYFELEVESEDGPYLFHAEKDVYMEIFTKISESHEGFYCALKTHTYVRMFGVASNEYDRSQSEDLLWFFKHFSKAIESKMDEYFLNKILETCSVNDGQRRFLSIEVFIDNFYEIVVNDLLGFIQGVLLEHLVEIKIVYEGHEKVGFFDDRLRNVSFFNVFANFIFCQDRILRSYFSRLSCDEEHSSEEKINDFHDFHDFFQQTMQLSDFVKNYFSDEKSLEPLKELNEELKEILFNQLNTLLITKHMSAPRQASGASSPDYRPESPSAFFSCCPEPELGQESKSFRSSGAV